VGVGGRPRPKMVLRALAALFWLALGFSAGFMLVNLLL
jgi:hypothetical protein